MIKTLIYIALLLSAVSCKTQRFNKKLVVDAGYFLDSSQTIEIDGRLRKIYDEGNYKLFLSTVIAEKYYEQKHFDEYIFNTISGKDTISNNNILLFISLRDSKIRILTGKKARTVLTDSLCQIGINRIIPEFRERKYYTGINTIINYIDSIFMQSNEHK